eukprot:8464606-Lingulodinium_polyedra.AAC.1
MLAWARAFHARSQEDLSGADPVEVIVQDWKRRFCSYAFMLPASSPTVWVGSGRPELYRCANSYLMHLLSAPSPGY